MQIAVQNAIVLNKVLQLQLKTCNNAVYFSAKAQIWLVLYNDK